MAIHVPNLQFCAPRERPAHISAAAANTATATDTNAINAALTEAAAAAIPDAAVFASAAPQAVSTSLKPRKRPREIGQITPTRQKTQPSSGTNIPSSASVARQATEKNVLKLNKVNLIGVYGSSSSRRALVRMPNGRYKKVQVGDRLDGGKVAAISTGELHYVKRGRNVVLRMPNS